MGLTLLILMFEIDNMIELFENNTNKFIIYVL